MFRLYNTLTRKTEDFKPIKKGKAGVYACGPTVYWFAHIGNMRAYVFVDVLRRALELEGFDVKLIMNITDVGHLTDDADKGEDKMLLAMRREGKTAYDIAKFYEAAFMKDLARLNIEPASKYPRATDHIKDQVKMIKRLEKNGFTYATSDGIYFDTSKLTDYGRLSGQKASEKKAGVRVEMGEKKNPTDFALWKFSPKDTKREMEWESPWGVGFPGWHIECSAMSMKYLGIPFDIHTGGVDHIAVHHENELAQTEGAEGKLEANVWMHNEFVTVDGGKMSKSLGNVFTLDDLIAKGFDPLAFRYLCLGAHYRTKLNFTWEALTAAQNALRKLRAEARRLSNGKADEALLETFEGKIADDLNTPEALAVMWTMLGSGSDAGAKGATLLEMDRVFGLGIADVLGKHEKVSPEVQKLVNERDAARQAKDWSESDRLRDEIVALGYQVIDAHDGTLALKRE